MHFRSCLVWLAMVAVSVPILCSCDAEIQIEYQSKTKDKGSSKEQTGSSLIPDLGELGKAGTDALNQAQKLTGNAAAEQSKVAAGEFFEAGLTALAVDPVEPTTAQQIRKYVIGKVPVLGPLQTYATARAQYQAVKKPYVSGVSADDDQLMLKARRGCLLALVEGSADVASFGVAGGAVKGVAAGMDMLLKGLKLSSKFAALTGIDQANYLNPFLDQALENKAVLEVVDSLLAAKYGG